MQLIDEDDVLRILDQLAHDLFQALFELSAILGTGNDQADIERKNSFVLEERRHIAAHDSLRQTLNDGSLTNARFADQDRIVFRAATENLNYSLSLVIAADQRIEPIIRGILSEISRELQQVRDVFAVTSITAALPSNLIAHGSQTKSALEKDLRGHRPLFTQKSEQ